MSAAVKVPHVHADVIKQWADGAQIEKRQDDSDEWFVTSTPMFSVHGQYRVKPAPTARVYPVTGMTGSECVGVFNAAEDDSHLGHWKAIANAAIRHAVDSGEILTLADHQAAIEAFGVKLRDAAAAREMAIAIDVWNECLRKALPFGPTMLCVDLPAIIAGVPC